MAPSQNSKPAPATHPSLSSAEDDTAIVDLANFGRGDPSPLIAASLERSTFPRLLRTMEEQPPAQSGEASATPQARKK